MSVVVTATPRMVGLPSPVRKGHLGRCGANELGASLERAHRPALVIRHAGRLDITPSGRPARRVAA
jgi:hypothetical protein